MLIEEIPNDKNAMKDLVDDNKKFIKGMIFAIQQGCNLQKTIKQNNKWKKDYVKQGYKLMTRKKIYNKIISLI